MALRLFRLLLLAGIGFMLGVMYQAGPPTQAQAPRLPEAQTEGAGFTTWVLSAETHGSRGSLTVWETPGACLYLFAGYGNSSGALSAIPRTALAPGKGC